MKKRTLFAGLLAGLVLFVASMAFGYLVNFVFPGLQAEYANFAIFRPWDDPLMMLYFLYPFVLSFVLAWFWQKASRLFEGPTWKMALSLTWVYFLMATVPGMLITYSSFQVSGLMTLSWTITGFVQVFFASLVLVKMVKN